MISTVVVSILAVTVALMVLAGSSAALFMYLRREIGAGNPTGEALETRVATLELQILNFPSLWEEERKRAGRSADSARKRDEAATEKLDSIQELIDAASNISNGDGTSVEEEQMQRVRNDVALPAEAPSGIEDRLAAVAHLLY